MLPICTRQEPSTCPSVEECKKCMGMYETLETEIKQLTSRLKVLRSMKASTAEVIAKFLRGHNKEEISTRDNRLHLKLENKSRLVPIGKRMLATKILDAFGGDRDKFEEFNRKVYGDQTTVSKVVLKRMSTRP